MKAVISGRRVDNITGVLSYRVNGVWEDIGDFISNQKYGADEGSRMVLCVFVVVLVVSFGIVCNIGVVFYLSHKYHICILSVTNIIFVFHLSP